MLYLALLVTTAGCKEGWSNENRLQYLQACADSPNVTGLSASERKAYCSCSLDVVMQHYQSVDQVLVNKDSVAVNAAMLKCRTKVEQ